MNQVMVSVRPHGIVGQYLRGQPGATDGAPLIIEIGDGLVSRDLPGELGLPCELSVVLSVEGRVLSPDRELQGGETIDVFANLPGG